MVEGIDSVGDAVTGGMAARTVEPRAGEAAGQGAACLNCGTALVGEHCHRCGQAAHVHRSLAAIWHDIAHSVLHFEGKVWRTLPLLAWRPGELTRRYIAGERARFVSPMALFLFSVFLTFAVFSMLGGPLDFGSDTPEQDRAEALRDLRREQAEARTKLGELQAELRSAKARGENTTGIEAEIRSVQRELKIEEQAYQLAVRLADQEEARDSAEPRTAEGEPQMNIISKVGWKPLDDAIDRAEKNPSLLFYKIQNNAYKFSWALIPMSVPFLWLLFLHRRRYRRYKVYDHTVFVTYSIAFMSLAAVALALLRPLAIGEALIGLAITFVPPIHMYRQLRGAYQLSRWSALWRTFVLLISAMVAASLFFTLLLTLGVLG
jgi:Protein of unknown function (DUF3667)